MLRERWRSLATGALIVGFAVLLVFDQRGGRCGPPIGGEAPDFALPALDGTEIKLAGLRGRVVLLNFWAAWCSSCLRKLPLLDQLRDEFTAQGLDVLAINVDGDHDATARFAARARLKLDMLLDTRGVGARYGVRALPHVVLVDRTGRVSFVQSGGGSLAKLRERVLAALREPAAAQRPSRQKR